MCKPFLPLLLALAGACAAPPRNPIEDAGPAELVAGGFQFIEGPVWSPEEGALFFSDIPASRIHRLDPPDAVSTFREESRDANGLILDREGRLLVCEHGARRISRTEADGSVVPLLDEFEGARLNSPNDLCLRSDGNLYITDPPYGLRGREPDLDGVHVFRRDPDGGMSVVWRGGFEARPNGIGLSPDERTLYVAFTDTGRILAFELDREGVPGAGRDFAATAGGADGLALDRHGNVYASTSAGIEVFAPDGTRWGAIEIPEKPANCAFGDPDARSLYVTARTGLYRVRLAVKGRY